LRLGCPGKIFLLEVSIFSSRRELLEVEEIDANGTEENIGVPVHPERISMKKHKLGKTMVLLNLINMREPKFSSKTLVFLNFDEIQASK